MNGLNQRLDEELARLAVGLHDGAKPPEGWFVLRGSAHAHAPSEVLARVKGVLAIVVERRGRIGDQEARAVLPAWFLQACAQPGETDTDDVDDEPWSLQDWLYWFEPENRHWH